MTTGKINYSTNLSQITQHRPRINKGSTSQNNRTISCTSKGTRAKQATETHTTATGKEFTSTSSTRTDPITQIDKVYQQDKATPRVTGTNWYQCTKAHYESMHKTSNRGSTAQPAADLNPTTENNSTRSTRLSPGTHKGPTRP
jgi:hypothetical protein